MYYSDGFSSLLCSIVSPYIPSSAFPEDAEQDVEKGTCGLFCIIAWVGVCMYMGMVYQSVYRLLCCLYNVCAYMARCGLGCMLRRRNEAHTRVTLGSD
ncbi:hypothetical protein BU23DRAFT_297823 [Bimuria novae-zelandiae CBS 107.79]|uniref:Uncharacterized protein n=1 Tax=Bimuria novae-zelandiae CBS 107.79 TaxID=1447943 RepID=A0A6A5VKM3_9PLEO|nr:hypothetical protein BU23DRAFT_297823 [Bimuria novae-zelandiae CBS 107.79]